MRNRIFQGNYNGANFELKPWKRIFSDFWHFSGFNQALKGIQLEKKYGKLYMSEQDLSSSTRKTTYLIP